MSMKNKSDDEKLSSVTFNKHKNSNDVEHQKMKLDSFFKKGKVSNNFLEEDED